MNSLIENGKISELSFGADFAYVLNDNGMFLPTEYKVLCNQVDRYFIRCIKMLYNGKVQLYYMPDENKNLAVLLQRISADQFVIIVANLISDVLDVKHNGFLSCCNIDLSNDHIFLDPKTMQVKLTYLPSSGRFYGDIDSFEADLRAGLAQIITNYPNLHSNNSLRLVRMLNDRLLSLEALYTRIVGEKQPRYQQQDGEYQDGHKKCCRIAALNAPGRFELTVDKPSYIIGKKAGMADGIINYNNTVSRSHCRIDLNGSEYIISDLGSLNGTYVNNVKLQPQSSCPIKNGDIIMLSNSSFRVIIE